MQSWLDENAVKKLLRRYFYHYCPVKVDLSLFKLIEIQSLARDFKCATI